MATVYKRENSPYWYASFYVKDDAGKAKQVRKPTKERSKAVAMKKAQEIEKEYKEGLGGGDEKGMAILAKMKEASDLALEGNLNAHTAQKLLSDILEISTGKELHSYTVLEWFNAWLKEKELHVKPSTFKHYKGVVTSFIAFLEDQDRADAKLQSLSRDEIIAFRQTYIDNGRVARTANYRVEAISSCLEDAKKEMLIPLNVAYGIKPLPEDDSKSRIPFSKTEAKKLIESAPDRDWKGVCLIAYYTGLRMGDITNLHWGQVNLEKAVITIKPRKTARTGKVLTIPLFSRLSDFLLTHPCPEDNATAFLFPSLAGIETKRLSKVFGNYMDSLNISRRVTILNDLGEETQALKSFHSFRHTLNSNLANADVEQELRSKITGHASKEINDLYTHTEVETLRRAIDKLEQI